MRFTRTIKVLAVCALAFMGFTVWTQPANASGGDLDTTFGIPDANNPKARIGIAQLCEGGDIVRSGEAFRANAVAIQPDGKIVAAGFFSPVAVLPYSRQFALVRWDDKGKLDTDFGDRGVVLTTIGHGRPVLNPRVDSNGKSLPPMPSLAPPIAEAMAIAIQPADGTSVSFRDPAFKIIVAGYATAGEDGEITVMALARYHSVAGADSSGKKFKAGDLDESFGTDKNGIVTGIDKDGNVTKQNVFGYASARANAVAIQQWDGKIVVAGSVDENNPSTKSKRKRFAVARYDRDGVPDKVGPGRGILTNFSQYGDSEARAVAIQAGGLIVAAGWTEVSVKDVVGYVKTFALARYDLNYSTSARGWLDHGFGDRGLISTSTYVRGNGSAAANAAAIQLNDGKIVAAGYVETNGRKYFQLVRYDPAPKNGANGWLDLSFNKTGIVRPSFGAASNEATAVAIQLDNRIVAAGNTTILSAQSPSALALARYNPDGALDTSFGPGKSTTTTQGTDGFTIVTTNGNGTVTTKRLFANPEAPPLSIWATAAAIDSNGNTVVAGHSKIADYCFTLARYKMQ